MQVKEPIRAKSRGQWLKKDATGYSAKQSQPHLGISLLEPTTSGTL